MKRLWLNKRYILNRSWQLAGTIFAVIGMAGMLANLDELILPSLDTWKRILVGVAILFGIWLFVFIGCCIFYSHVKIICALKLSNNHGVYVQYGDLFKKDIICDKHGEPSAEIRNVIIPVNCCFDTIVDNDLVSSTKIHGIAFCSLYDSGKYSQESLNQTIQDNLNSRNIAYTDILATEKRKGNLKRYPFGTVAEIPISDEEKYFLLALTEFNSDLHAEIRNRENYMIVLQRLIEYISTRSQGFPVVMPLIGGGLPEVSESEQAVMELLISLIKLNRDKLNCDIHIVIRDTGKEDISFLKYK